MKPSRNRQGLQFTEDLNSIPLSDMTRFALRDILFILCEQFVQESRDFIENNIVVDENFVHSKEYFIFYNGLLGNDAEKFAPFPYINQQ